MEKQRNIDSYFDGIIENINIILNNNFYNNDDKRNLKNVKIKIENWYKIYKDKKTLKGIETNGLENIELEITDFFDKYVVTESVKENYAERLLYDFGHLEMKRKTELLGGNL